eukprot:COSAG02_NODE_3044_length_7482_cov_3.060680_3_plen_332_part_00
MLKYAALGVLVRLALWLSPMQGYFASSMQCATPLTSAARRASVALHSTALCDLCRPQCSSAQLRGLSARRSRNSVRYRAFVALSYLAGVMSARYTLPVDEGAFWVESGQSPYAEDARIVYQPPFIVFMQSALRSMPSPGGDGFWSTVALSLADIIAAAALRQLASPAKETLLATARPGRSTTVAIAYLFNPQIVAACVAGSTVAYSNAATLLSLSLATRGKHLHLRLPAAQATSPAMCCILRHSWRVCCANVFCAVPIAQAGVQPLHRCWALPRICQCIQPCCCYLSCCSPWNQQHPRQLNQTMELRVAVGLWPLFSARLRLYFLCCELHD